LALFVVSMADQDGLEETAMQKHMRNVVLIVAAVIIAGVSVWGPLAFADPKKVKPKALVPQTGQTTCVSPVPIPGGIDCTGTGQDGDIQTGVALPTPRFKDNADGTITDNLTGLRWLKDVGCIGNPTWLAGFSRVTELNSGTNLFCTDYVPGTFSDWRISNINELHSLINYGFFLPAISNAQGNAKWSAGDPFVNLPVIIQSGAGFILSSTPVSQLDPNTGSIWAMQPAFGVIFIYGPDGGFFWPVRGPE